MKETISFSAQAETFQSVIDWNALKSNVAILGHKVINLVASETFCMCVAGASALGSWIYILTDHPVRFAVTTAIACIALARTIVPMAKGGEQ
ncbi:MAG: hypothetical protein IJ352_06780 [Muribaculaceae bacterium]|nr:hypothetical protein [Muribaculaceae bacterium]